jgi:type II secretory pathway pseudopilin PulG
MNYRSAQYSGYTLGEVLVVLMIVIILGSAGAFSFGGLRDSVLVKQGIEDIKQDLQLTQQKAMLIEKKENEWWIYGIGIDFTEISEGKYTFVKWCSPFSTYGHAITRSEIIAYDKESSIGTNLAGGLGLNAVLPVSPLDPSGFCNDRGQSYMTNMPGLEEGKLTAGFDIGLLSSGDEAHVTASYVVFEAVTGRVFLYDEEGVPISYMSDGTYLPERKLELLISRNRGAMADHISVASLSGTVSHDVIKEKSEIDSLRSRMVSP